MWKLATAHFMLCSSLFFGSLAMVQLLVLQSKTQPSVRMSAPLPFRNGSGEQRKELWLKYSCLMELWGYVCVCVKEVQKCLQHKQVHTHTYIVCSKSIAHSKWRVINLRTVFVCCDEWWNIIEGGTIRIGREDEGKNNNTIILIRTEMDERDVS